jgi:hypothetical protein
MSALALGLSLALLASLALNASFLLQHVGAAAAPDVSPLRPVRTVVGLLRSPRWSAGLALGLSGWGLHVAALSRAPLSLVQAFVAGGLALTVPAASRWLGHRLRPVESGAVLAMAAALVLLSIGAASGGRPEFSSAALAAFLVASAGVAAAAVALPIRLGRAEALGAAAGILYGDADVAIKVLTGVASEHGTASVLRSPWLAAAALTTAGAFFCFQRGLQLGRAVPVIALMTAGTYVVSIGAGLALLGDPLGGSALAAAHLAAFAVVVGAAWVLGRSQAALSGTAERPRAPRAGPPEVRLRASRSAASRPAPADDRPWC